MDSLEQNLDQIGSLLLGGIGGFDDVNSEDEEDLSGLPPEIKQLREKERRSETESRGGRGNSTKRGKGDKKA